MSSFSKFKVSDKIVIKNITGSYPSNDNCYNIEINNKIADINDPSFYSNNYASRACVDIFLKMKEILTDKQIEELYPFIEKVWDDGYNEANDNHSLDEAGEDL